MGTLIKCKINKIRNNVNFENRKTKSSQMEYNYKERNE